MNGHWHGFGVLAAHDIIDDIFTIIADTDLRMRFKAASDSPERIVESRIEISHKIETEHTIVLDAKILYAQYRVAQMESLSDLVLQGET